MLVCTWVLTDENGAFMDDNLKGKIEEKNLLHCHFTEFNMELKTYIFVFNSHYFHFTEYLSMPSINPYNE
jgi:hypothetical protein